VFRWGVSGLLEEGALFSYPLASKRKRKRMGIGKTRKKKISSREVILEKSSIPSQKVGNRQGAGGRGIVLNLRLAMVGKRGPGRSHRRRKRKRRLKMGNLKRDYSSSGN